MIIFLSSLLCCYQGAYCGSEDNLPSVTPRLEMLQHNLEVYCNESNPEKSRMNKTILEANIHYIESKVLSKIKHAESKMEKYQRSLNESQNGAEVQIWLKKIRSTEKNIRNLNEVLLAIELIKARVEN